MNEQPLETLIEVREDFMLSPASDSKPTLRKAHFLKPIANSIDEPAFKFNPFSSSSSSVSELKEWPFATHFHGWRYHQEKWVCWVDKLKPKYESVWKKAEIFEAIMSTKCRILKNRNLLYGVVEKWCCETNTFVFPFGEATITLEDVMVLGGYPVLGDSVFKPLQDQEMTEVEQKLIIARYQLANRKRGVQAITSMWIDMFNDKGSEIEHEAFLATWLSIFVFPHRCLVKNSLFPIAVHLARGNPIALAPAVLASLYKDLTLFKKKIVDLSKFPVGGDRYPLEVTLLSPFYLVQIWVWERFKNLQPQPMLINHGDPFLVRWHMVKALKIDNVKLALDSASDDFHWCPYVRYSDKFGMFYPNDEIWIPFKEDLDKQMLSFVTCLRVSELVGFDSIEQYLPHRVAMQFGIDQDVPSYLAKFNETEPNIAWKNYFRPIYDEILYFPPRLFEADVTTRYAKWWRQSILSHSDFVKNIVRKKRSPGSRKHRPFVRKANISGNDVGVPPGFPPNLVDTLFFGKLCDDGSKTKTRKVDEFYADVHYENSVHDCSQMTKHNTLVSSIYVEDSYNRVSKATESILPLKRPVSKDNLELSVASLDEGFKDAKGSNKAKMSSDRICLSETQGKSYAIRNKVSSFNKVTVDRHDVQFQSDNAARVGAKETVEEKEREENDHEVVVLLKEQYLKNQKELARMARQQEEMLRLMALREKRDEELRQLLTNVLRNQQPPSSS